MATGPLVDTVRGDITSYMIGLLCSGPKSDGAMITARVAGLPGVVWGAYWWTVVAFEDSKVHR
jgi:hypothetical protein